MGSPSKNALVEALRENGAWVEACMSELPDERLAEGRYENGWDGKQILAHIAAVEWTYPRLLDLARESKVGGGTGSGRPRRAARGGIDEYNRRQVERREGMEPRELIEEFRRNREALIQAVEDADDALFDIEIESAGGRTGPLARVLREIAIEHVRQHVSDILGDEGQTGT